jgi:hypothetical protein
VNRSFLRLSCVVLLWASGAALAAGTVTQLAGTLSVKRADGSVRILAQKSQVIVGDVLETQKDSYAQVRFDDGAEVTLKPNTQFAVQAYVFKPAEPKDDNVAFRLIKGGLRAVTGLIGKRGKQDDYLMETATATIGIRGTTFDADDCRTTTCRKGSGNVEEGPGLSAEMLEAAVYVSVRDGQVLVSNPAGSLLLGAGQFGAVAAANLRPQLLPGDPGLGALPDLSLREAVTSRGHGKDCE